MANCSSLITAPVIHKKPEDADSSTQPEANNRHGTGNGIT